MWRDTFDDVIGPNKKFREFYRKNSLTEFSIGVHNVETNRRETHHFYVEGDCCSSSWIEHFEAPDPPHYGNLDIYIESVEEPELPKEDRPDSCTNPLSGYKTDCLAVYQTVFRLSNGESITLEYRNDSNGYYGGYVVKGKVDA